MAACVYCERETGTEHDEHPECAERAEQDAVGLTRKELSQRLGWEVGPKVILIVGSPAYYRGDDGRFYPLDV